jgi:hypothetical protein
MENDEMMMNDLSNDLYLGLMHPVTPVYQRKD